MPAAAGKVPNVADVGFALSAIGMLMFSLASLGSKLFDRYVSYYGAQSAVLAFATGLIAFERRQVDLWVLAVLTILLKGVVIPVVTRRLLIRRLGLKRDAAVAIGLSSALLAGVMLTGFAFLVTEQAFPAIAATGGGSGTQVVTGGVVAIATAITLIGALSTVVRRHTVAQLFGWLVVENGVFLGAIALLPTFAFIVEAGVFLDLVAGVLIMLVVVSGLARRLASVTAVELRELEG